MPARIVLALFDDLTGILLGFIWRGIVLSPIMYAAFKWVV